MSAQAMRRTGWALTGLFVLFMLFDVAIKWFDLAVVDEAMLQLGYPRGVGFWIGVLETILLVLYVVPRTSVLGAVLFIGVFGGAIASHLRVGDPLLSLRRLSRRRDVGRAVAARPDAAGSVSGAARRLTDRHGWNGAAPSGRGTWAVLSTMASSV